MIRKGLFSLFSTARIPIEAVKRLREQTSAPVGECKRALQETHCNHQDALQWLKQRGLMTADKHLQKETREGVIASYLTPCRRRALLLEVNCETDFVAKSDLFLRFVDGLGKTLLEREDALQLEGQQEELRSQFNQILADIEPQGIFPDDTSVRSLGEEFKLVISRLQENIRIRRVITLHSDFSRFGNYVHRPYQEAIGLQACIVELSTQPDELNQQQQEKINQFADDMATQILGLPPKYLSFEEIPQEKIDQQLEKARNQAAAILQKAPEHTHEKILAGKLMSGFYSQSLLGCMPFLLSREGEQVSQQWNRVEEETGSTIAIRRSIAWECK